MALVDSPDVQEGHGLTLVLQGTLGLLLRLLLYLSLWASAAYLQSAVQLHLSVLSLVLAVSWVPGGHLRPPMQPGLKGPPR